MLLAALTSLALWPPEALGVPWSCRSTLGRYFRPGGLVVWHFSLVACGSGKVGSWQDEDEVELGPPTLSPSNQQPAQFCTCRPRQHGFWPAQPKPKPKPPKPPQAHCRTQKINSPHRLPTKSSVGLLGSASAPALPHLTRLALPSTLSVNPTNATTA